MMNGFNPAYFPFSSVKAAHRNLSAEGDHARMVNATIGAPCGMAGDVSIFPNTIAVGVPAKDNKSRLGHPFSSL